MFCPYCAAPTADDHAFCHACGAVLPGARRGVVHSSPPGTLLSAIGDPGIRFLVCALGGLVVMLVLGELLKFVVGLALPCLIVLAIVYWARERRRRYY